MIATIAAGVSIAFLLLTFLLAFLIIPIYLFPFISFFCGGVAYIAIESNNNTRKMVLRSLFIGLMAIAVGVFVFWYRVLSTEAWH